MTTTTAPKTQPVSRFQQAQDRNWPRIARELATGRKETHWMWFVFPQLQGLAKSEIAHRFGIRDKEEVLAYLGNHVLRSRLGESTLAVLRHPRNMFGDTDRKKLRSCMTLFREVSTDPTLPDAVLAKFYGGELCQTTIDILSGRLVPPPFKAPRAVPAWSGSAQGRVEVRGQRSFWEAQVRKAQHRQYDDGPMSPRQIRSYLLGLGLTAYMVDEIASRWVDDQNQATQQGWEARDAER